MIPCYMFHIIINSWINPLIIQELLFSSVYHIIVFEIQTAYRDESALNKCASKPDDHSLKIILHPDVIFMIVDGDYVSQS